MTSMFIERTEFVIDDTISDDVVFCKLPLQIEWVTAYHTARVIAIEMLSRFVVTNHSNYTFKCNSDTFLEVLEEYQLTLSQQVSKSKR